MNLGRTFPFVVAVAFVTLTGCRSTLTPVDERSSDDGGPEVGAVATCDARKAAASNAVQSAVSTASADLSCAKDDDCTFAGNSSACSASCGVLLNTAGAARVQAAIDDVNARTCRTFAQDGCRVVIPPCAPHLGGVACVSGRCASVSGRPTGR